MTVQLADPEKDALAKQAEAVRNAIPGGGLFAEKEWRVTPIPFPLEKKEVRFLEKLGPMLLRFQQASDVIYRRSRKGSLPEWIAEDLDRGKPRELIERGLASPVVESTPRVIRPDLILTENGFTAAELDAVPGGIGLTAWLGKTYAGILPESQIIGGGRGMLEGFSSIFPEEGADIVISEESSDYRPEMEWIASQLEKSWEVHDAADYEPADRDVYRFFELFDLPNLPGAKRIAEAAADGTIHVTNPFKPWLEEKMWSALFWSHPLKEVWSRELREANFQRLQEIFPRSWIVHPETAPHYAVLPGLDIQHFSELGDFSQTERELVLKLSGFSENAWGSRSVTIGQDVSQEDWKSAVENAIAAYSQSPYVLQRFHSGRLVTHPWWNQETGKIEMMEGRVRLCPYYFVNPKSKQVMLGGVLATICPADKKILHGMRDAILAPCAVV